MLKEWKRERDKRGMGQKLVAAEEAGRSERGGLETSCKCYWQALSRLWSSQLSSLLNLWALWPALILLRASLKTFFVLSLSGFSASPQFLAGSMPQAQAWGQSWEHVLHIPASPSPLSWAIQSPIHSTLPSSRVSSHHPQAESVFCQHRLWPLWEPGSPDSSGANFSVSWGLSTGKGCSEFGHLCVHECMCVLYALSQFLQGRPRIGAVLDWTQV